MIRSYFTHEALLSDCINSVSAWHVFPIQGRSSEGPFFGNFFRFFSSVSCGQFGFPGQSTISTSNLRRSGTTRTHPDRHGDASGRACGVIVEPSIASLLVVKANSLCCGSHRCVSRVLLGTKNFPTHLRVGPIQHSREKQKHIGGVTTGCAAVTCDFINARPTSVRRHLR